MKRLACLLISGLLLLVRCSGSGTETVALGGSGTETVGVMGVMVDTTGHPVVLAKLALLSGDTVRASALTDSDGAYLLTTEQAGAFAMRGYTGDSSLAIAIPLVRTDSLRYVRDRKDSSLLLVQGNRRIEARDVKLDTMRAPGSISGTVTTPDGAKAGVTVFIPGTSYAAFCDLAGAYRISNIPAGTYAVYFLLSPYELDSVSSVAVVSGRESALAAMALRYDPEEDPPPPKGLAFAYDTALGVVTLTWHKVTDLTNLLGYRVFVIRGTDNPVLLHAGQWTDTIYKDTVFKSRPDTVSLSVKYQVLTVNSSFISGRPGTPVSVEAAAPALVRTRFTWVSRPAPAESLTTADTVRIAVSYANQTRQNRQITWRIDSSSSKPVRQTTVAGSTGQDSLRYVHSRPGRHWVFVAADDNAGNTWSDSLQVELLDESIGWPSDKWVACKPLAVARRQASVAELGGKLYVVGGCVDVASRANSWAALTSVEVYDPEADTSAAGAPLDTGRYDCGLAACSGKLYLFGGQGTRSTLRSIKCYDPSTNAWKTVADLPAARSGVAACAVNDKIYLSGGINEDDFAASSSIDIFDPVTNSLAAASGLLQARALHQAVPTSRGIYFIGGIGGDGDVATTTLGSVELFVPGSGSVSQAAALSAGRARFGAGVFDTSLVLAGGLTGNLLDKVVGSVQVYGSGSALTSLPSARHSFAACTYRGRLFVFGGSEGAPSDRQPGVINKVDKYYPPQRAGRTNP